MKKIFISLLCCLSLNSGLAQTPTTNEARLRDAFRSQAQQLAAAQDQISQLQAAQVANNKAVADLKGQLDVLQKKAEATEKANQEKLNEAKAKVTEVSAQNALLTRQNELNQTRNLELARLGNEILDRYAKFSLGEALVAKEPFVGLTRVKLQNLVQGYQDKLAENRIPVAKK